MKHPQNFAIERHPDFGFFQIKPTPTHEEITRFYAEEFYSSKYKAFNNSSLEVQEADRDFHDAHREDIAETIQRLTGRPLSGLSVLDIGCGWGQTMKYLAQKGANCVGFDPAPEAVAYVKSCGLECEQAGMERMDVFGARRFDVVMLMNVLEHLADPVTVIRDIKATVLSPGGVLVVEVPNEFNAFQLAAQSLYQLHQWWVAPPAHLNYFNPETLGALLSGSGFDVCYLEASFPMEMFLLMGDDYVSNPEVGRACHQKRVAFEMNLRRTGQTNELRAFYKALASVNLGRQVIAYAKKKAEKNEVN